MPESVPTILVAEDDHADVLLLETAAARAKIGSSLHVVGDGQEALEYLGAKDQPMPYLVILDLNMPRMDGKRAIHEIRANESTRHLPVVVMSTSSATADVRECLELGANAFLVKPPSVGELAKRIRALEDFWLQTAAPGLH